MQVQNRELAHSETECQVWAKPAKLSFLTVHIFKFKSVKEKTVRNILFNNQGL